MTVKNFQELVLNSMNNKINLNSFGKLLSSRSLAATVFEGVKQEELIIINFLGVEEATPSFCHEMLEILLKNKKAKIDIINANDFIKNQINKALMSIESAGKGRK